MSNQNKSIFSLANLESNKNGYCINLIVNSIQVLSKSGIIEIKIDENNHDAIIQFIDSGEGIPD